MHAANAITTVNIGHDIDDTAKVGIANLNHVTSRVVVAHLKPTRSPNPLNIE